MDDASSSSSPELELPGFRFHPTEEELLNFYLRGMVFGKKLHGHIISLLNIYRYHPTELPGLARINSEREWYFFVPRDRKHGSGGRPNRTTENGFWKATGSDRKILGLSAAKQTLLGVKKTLVFYEGRAPRGRKTDWIMNEYRLPDACSQPQEIVLVKIYRKATPLKVLEQRAAMDQEEDIKTCISPPPFSDPSMESISFCGLEDVEWGCTTTATATATMVCNGRESLAELMNFNTDWNWTFDNMNIAPFVPMC